MKIFDVIDEACMPKKGSKFAACIDLRSRIDITIEAGQTVKIPLGVKIKKDCELNGQNVYLQLMLRSSLGAKGLILPNGVGIIDIDYKDEIKMIIHNPTKPYEILENGVLRTYIKGTDKVTIKKGDRIAQITVLEHHAYLFGLESKDERVGGFGSTNRGYKRVPNGETHKL